MLRVVAALAIVLALPAVLAQAPVVPAELTLTMQAPDRPIEPLGDAVALPLLLETPCHAAYAADPLSVQWAVTQQPSWATVVVDPASDSAGIDRCEGGPTGTLRLSATAYVEASDQAPAFAYELVEVEATSAHPFAGTRSARASVPVAAAFFSIIDVQSPVQVLPAGEGLAAAFPVRVTNHGNANTKVTFEAEGYGSVAVDVPEPLFLQSRQAGGHEIARDLVVKAYPASDLDRPAPFVLRWRATYALDGQLAGDSGEVRFLVQPGRGTSTLAALAGGEEGQDARQQVPGAGAVGAALALAIGAFALRRRRR